MSYDIIWLLYYYYYYAPKFTTLSPVIERVEHDGTLANAICHRKISRHFYAIIVDEKNFKGKKATTIAKS